MAIKRSIYADEIGRTGTTIYSGRLEEEFNLDIRNEKGFGQPGGPAGIYEEMRQSDATTQLLLLLSVLPVVSAEPTVTIHPDGDPAFAKQIHSWLFEEMQTNPATLLRWICDGYFGDGFALGEVRLGTSGGAWKPMDVGQRLAKSIYAWHLDADGRKLEEVEQWVQGDGVTDSHPRIPAEKILLWSNGGFGLNFQGVSLFRPCYAAWKIKQMLLRYIGVRGERAAIGVPILFYEPGAESEMDNFKQILRTWRSHEKSYILLNRQHVQPDGLVVKHCDSERLPLGEDIATLNQEILSAGAAAFFNLGMTATGARSVGEIHADFWQMAAAGHARVIADGFQPLINKLVDWNFGKPANGKYPYVELRGVKRINWGQVAQLLQTGLLTADSEMEQVARENFMLPSHRVSVPEAKPEAAEQEADNRGVGAHDHAERTWKMRAGGVVSWRELRPEELRYDWDAIRLRFDSAPREVQGLFEQDRDRWLAAHRQDFEDLIRAPQAARRAQVDAMFSTAEMRAMTKELRSLLQQVRIFGQRQAQKAARKDRLTPPAERQEQRTEAANVAEPGVGSQGALERLGQMLDRPITLACADVPDYEPTTFVSKHLGGREGVDKLLDNEAARLADIWRAALADSTAGAVQEAQAQVSMGVDAGQAVGALTNDLLALALDKPTKGAWGIIARAFNLGEDEFANMVGTGVFTKIKYSALLDERVCDECEAADMAPAVVIGSPEEADLPNVPNPDCDGNNGGCNMCRCVWTYF